MRELTPRQREVLDTIARLTRERGIAPTLREIADAIGVASHYAVVCLLRPMERAGVVTRDRATPRSIRILTPPVEPEPEKLTAEDLERTARRFGYDPDAEYLGDWIVRTAAQAGLREVA